MPYTGTRSPEKRHALAQKVRRLRTYRGLTMEQLAKKSGVTIGTVARLETEVQDPSLLTLEKLAEGLDVAPEDLLGGANGHR